MSKSNSEAFPFPVLTNDEDSDFNKSFFNSNISLQTIESDQSTETLLDIIYELDLENKEINNLIDGEKADFALSVTSKSTGYREVFLTQKKKKGKISIPLGEVYDRLEIEAQVIITGESIIFSSEDLNDEYKLSDDGEPEFVLTTGDPIAFSDVFVKMISFEPLTLQSLIRVNLDTELNPDIYSVDTSSNDYLTINMGSNFKEKWDDTDSRKHLVNGVIKDAILISLKEYIENREDVEMKRWASLILEQFKEVENDIFNYRNDFDKLNQIALQIAAQYTIGKMTKISEE